jgi:molybdopterin adenylyltransferase
MGFRAVVITVSDRGARGERKDGSGPEVAGILQAIGMEIVARQIIPDEKELIRRALIEWSDGGKSDLIVTTGGTGVSPRDVTPDATREAVEREIPGMAEAMRQHSLTVTPYAMISRAMAGIRGQTLIINLPGSPKGARENLNVILPALVHAIEKIKGDTKECASRSTPAFKKPDEQ